MCDTCDFIQGGKCYLAAAEVQPGGAVEWKRIGEPDSWADIVEVLYEQTAETQLRCAIFSVKDGRQITPPPFCQTCLDEGREVMDGPFRCAICQKICHFVNSEGGGCCVCWPRLPDVSL